MFKAVEDDGVTFGADHGGTFADPSEGLAEVLAATNDYWCRGGISAAVEYRR